MITIPRKRLIVGTAPILAEIATMLTRRSDGFTAYGPPMPGQAGQQHGEGLPDSDTGTADSAWTSYRDREPMLAIEITGDLREMKATLTLVMTSASWAAQRIAETANKRCPC